jgi:hypothetical protein
MLHPEQNKGWMDGRRVQWKIRQRQLTAVSSVDGSSSTDHVFSSHLSREASGSGSTTVHISF